MRSTEDNRRLIAEIFEIPADEVLHYAIVIHGRRGLGTSFCGLSRNGIALLASGIATMAVEGDAMDAACMAAGGGSGCDWPQPK
jgi:hypothetical protein